MASVHKLFSVFDSKVNAYMRPFCAPSGGAAERSFVKEVNTPDSPMNDNPEDYTLFELGEFNDENGQITVLSTPHPLVKAITVLKPAA